MSKQYRYPGAKPFSKDEQDLFFGREADTKNFLQLIQLEQMITLHAKSGIGKSSLLNAGVFPQLENSSDSLPFLIRFGAYDDKNKQTPLEIIKREISPEKPQFTYLDKILLNENSLWYHCKTLQKNSPDVKQIVLIFDQFEELFTYPDRELAYFKDELADLLYSKIPANFREMLKDEELRNSLTEEEQHLLYQPLSVKVVFAIRSDKISLMDKLKDTFQTILRNTYELQPLNKQQARDAIINPAQKDGDYLSPSFEYSDDVIHCILRFLSHEEKSQKNRSIESFQLQYVCLYIENKVIEQKIKLVEPEHIEKDLNKIVEDFYQQALNSFDDEKEQEKAQQITQDLIHKNIRITKFSRVLMDEYDVDQKFLNRLVDARLIRRQTNYEGRIFYELTHDTLIEPVRKAKEKRLQEEELRKERKKRQEARKWFISISVVAGIAILFAVFGFWQWNKAEKALKEVERQKEKKDKIIDAFYFYGDSLALAYDGNYYGFIDKEGNPLIGYKYRKALPFEFPGFARVEDRSRAYLIDTKGNEYPLAEDMNDLTPETEALDLRDKKLTEIPAEVFQNTQLKILLLNENDIKTLPSDIGNLTQLTKLSLSSNQISDLSPLQDLTQLTKLSLSSNQISDLSPLQDLTQLTKLYLGGNQISDLSPLQGLTQLTTLDLSSNQISDLSPLQDLLQLTWLDLYDNQIRDLSPLQDLTQLTTLFLVDNQISDLSPLQDLTQLTTLRLWNNQISDLSPLQDLTQLTTLGLSDNQISDLSPLQDLTQLDWLDLSSNQISDLSPLQDLTQLTELDLRSNQISDLSPLQDLTQLTRLRLGNNQISDLSPLQDLTQLTSLDLEGNQISDLAPLQDLTQLTSLGLGGILSGNQISDLSPLQDLTQLTRLRLGNNQISDLSPLQDLTQLTSLGLYDNQISDLSPLQDLTQLTSLDLGGNQISDLSPLQDLTQLTGLDLKGNQISDLSPLQDLTQLIWLDLSGTNISVEEKWRIEKMLPECHIVW